MFACFEDLEQNYVRLDEDAVNLSVNLPLICHGTLATVWVAGVLCQHKTLQFCVKHWVCWSERMDTKQMEGQENV